MPSFLILRRNLRNIGHRGQTDRLVFVLVLVIFLFNFRLFLSSVREEDYHGEMINLNVCCSEASKLHLQFVTMINTEKRYASVKPPSCILFQFLCTSGHWDCISICAINSGC